MHRIIHAIVLETEPLVDGSLRAVILSWEYGKLIAYVRKSKKLLFAPSFYQMEGDFKSEVFFACHGFSMMEEFSRPHHFDMHTFCVQVLGYLPFGMPHPFAFGRYLSSLRKSKDLETARRNALWFVASFLYREGLLDASPELRRFMFKRDAVVDTKKVWRKVREGMKNLAVGG